MWHFHSFSDSREVEVLTVVVIVISERTHPSSGAAVGATASLEVLGSMRSGFLTVQAGYASPGSERAVGS